MKLRARSLRGIEERGRGEHAKTEKRKGTDKKMGKVEGQQSKEVNREMNIQRRENAKG